MSLTRLGCQVQFIGYREFTGELSTLVRLISTRSNKARKLVEPLALRKFNLALITLARRFEPELVLVIKGEAVLPRTVDWLSQYLGAVTAIWFPDDPRYFGSLSKVIARHYDYCFTPSQKFVPQYEDAGSKHVSYLPFACEPSVHKHITLSSHDREILASDICFVGSFSLKRAKVISVLEKNGFKVKTWGPYWRYFRKSTESRGPLVGLEMARVFNAAKVVLNIHEESDMSFKPNMRVFEAAGCQSLLLTDRPFGLDRCFTPGKEILSYENHGELVELAHQYVSKLGDCSEIAAKGGERAYRDHTYDKRLRTLLMAVS
jgi:spore maturation protein CgeB